MTYLDPERLPPLRPMTTGAKASVSCHKPFNWLIRAWAPVAYRDPYRLVDWILYHVGRMNCEDLEWWGFTYGGQPSYMGDVRKAHTSGLTIQRYVEPTNTWQKTAMESGRLGPAYGSPSPLVIPEPGVVLATRVH